MHHLSQKLKLLGRATWMILYLNILVQFLKVKRVRQWDPPSLFLFSVVNMLSCLVSKSVNNWLVNDLTVREERVLVSHLQFVNDIVFFLELGAHSFVNIWSILCFFEVIFGVKINLAKSGFASINMDNQILNAFAISSPSGASHLSRYCFEK